MTDKNNQDIKNNLDIKNIICQLHSRYKNTDILYDEIKSIDYCYTSTHDTCLKIYDILNILINNKLEIPENLINRYFQITCTSIECWSNNYDNNLAFILYIFENIKLTDSNIKYLINTKNSEVMVIFLNNYKYINGNILKNICSSDNYYYKTINDFIVNNNNQEYINILFENSIKAFDSNTIEKLLDNKINVSKDIFVKIIRISFNIKNGLDLIKKCILNGGQIEKNTLKLAISEYIHTYSEYYDRYSDYYTTTIYEIDKIIMFLFDNGSTDITISEILCLNINKYKQDLINYLIDNNIVTTK